MMLKYLPALLVVALVGCGESGPPMAQVSGTVTYEGQPLTAGTITFVPQGSDLPFAYATIREDGTYQAETPDFGDGVAVGNHKVMISAVKDMGPEAPVELLIPSKYSSDAQSGLTANVSEGENTIDFPLEADDSMKRRKR